MAISNRERIAKGLDLVRIGLAPFVERELKDALGPYWVEEVSQRLMDGLPKAKDGAINWDTQLLLKVMSDNWMTVFKKTLGHAERALVGELREVRNRWAHEQTFSSDDTYRALDSIQRLLQAISAADDVSTLEQSKQELLRAVFAEQARQKTRYQVSVEGKPKAGLQFWRDVITPHPDVASGRYLQAEFAADLAQVYRGEGSDEYRDPIEFYRRTYLTDGLRKLLVGALERFTGSGGDPVVELQTNFGGGKTHSMLALYHLVGAATTTDLPGIEGILQEVGIDQVPKTRRAVLVGTALSVGQHKPKDDGTVARTMWGEMAWQLGGKAGYQFVAESDEKGVSPGSNVLTSLLRECAPCLVLIDEWVTYARQLINKNDLPAGNFEAQATFAQALTEAAKAVDGALVVASIPSSNIEVGGDHGRHALDTLKNIFERVGTPWRPATAGEGFEIVRRRLFEPLVDKEQFANRDAVIDAFSKMYRDAQNDFPVGCGEGSYRRKLEAAYPMHPELFERLYEDWSTLDKFQRTRGVLRLLARAIHSLWEGGDKSLLIMPASLPMDDPGLKDELTRYLDDNWEPIISADVDGPNSLPRELDGSTPNLGRYSACRRVARAVYVGSAPGSRGANPGVDDRQVRLACTQPGETAATFGDALRRLTDKATYLYVDGNRYWYSTQPSVTRIAADRARQVEPEAVQDELVSRLRKYGDKGEFDKVHVAPESTIDVPDECSAKLVIFGPQHAYTKGKADSPGLIFAKEILSNRGGSPRLNRNMLVFLAPDKSRIDDLEDSTRQYLAWASICKEHEKLELTPSQKRQAESKRNSAEETVGLKIKESWVYVLVPSQPDPKGSIEWEEVRANGTEGLASRTSAKLVKDEYLVPSMSAMTLAHWLDRFLWPEEAHIPFSQLEEYLCRYLYLPRIKDRSTLVRAVQDGAADLGLDFFAVAAGYDAERKRYLGLRSGSANVIIEKSTLLVRPSAAQDQILTQPGGETIGRRPTRETPVLKGTSESATTEPGLTQPNFFHGSVKLNPTRVGRDAGRVAEEVLQHLSTLPGAKVEVSLEIQVRVPDGLDEKVVRTVTENANTLSFNSHGFEKE